MCDQDNTQSTGEVTSVLQRDTYRGIYPCGVTPYGNLCWKWNI